MARQHERARSAAALWAAWVAIAAASNVAVAQPDSASDPGRCAQIESREARLQCYDRVFATPADGSSAPGRGGRSAAPDPTAEAPQTGEEASTSNAETAVRVEARVEPASMGRYFLETDADRARIRVRIRD
jgi:hypothetical protein